MTTNRGTMALAKLAEQGPDVDLLQAMIRFVAQRLMCGAGYREHTAERVNRRNGYRSRMWDTRAAPLAAGASKLPAPIGQAKANGRYTENW